MWLLFSTVFASEWDPEEGEVASKLLELHDQEKWATLMPQAREYIKAYPESLTGHYVFGRGLWLGHAEHARAMHHLEIAEKIYYRDYEQKEIPPWKLFSKLLFSMQNIAGDMGENEKELELIKKYNDEQDVFLERFNDSYYKLIGERGWPLMKLERYEEARMAAREGIETERSWQESLGYNVLCAVEAEEGNRQAAQDNCIAALEHALGDMSGIAIDASNAANASFSVLDFERVEAFAIEGTEAGGRTHPAWMNLVDLYLLQGKGGAVLSAMKGLRKSHASEEPHMRSQHKADIEALFATILLFAGEDEKAMQAINLAIRAPDRRGSISTSEEQTLGGHMALRYFIRKMAHEREKEKATAKGVLGRLEQAKDMFLPDPALLADAVAVRSVLSDEKRLLYTFHMYQDRGLVDVLPCLLGGIVEILGPGISQVALDRVRAKEEFPKMMPYFDALEVDIAYQRGDYGRMARLAESAKDALPLDEAVLIARMNGFLGWYHEKNGNIALALPYYTEAYNKDPSLFRRMGWSLPAILKGPIAGIMADVVKGLGRSPRFHHHNQGFVLDIQDMAVCLLSPMGAQLMCAPNPSRVRIELVEEEGKEPVEKEVQLTDDEYIFEIIDGFHLAAFGLANGDTGVDWGSLDGSTTTSRHSTQQKLKQMLTP